MFNRRKDCNVFCADLETITKGETTRAWSAAIVQLYTEDVQIYPNLGDLITMLERRARSAVVYFHNLKFDGEFVLYELFRRGYTLAWDEQGGFKKQKEMQRRELECLISDRGQFYTITICLRRGVYVEFRDSYKLLPFSLKKVGKDFKTKHQKTEMVYDDKESLADCTEEDLEYIRNDVLVMKEAIEIMYNDGHDKLTIGSCCYKEFRGMWDKDEYESLFPNPYELPLYGHSVPNVGEFCKRAYAGGWCYKVGGDKLLHTGAGFTVDANSLYPSVMHSASGNEYPIGEGYGWTGDIPEKAKLPHRYYYVHIRCRFKLKEGYLPWVHIRCDRYYRATKSLTTSDFEYKGKFYRYRYDEDGSVVEARPDLYLTCTDFELLKEHYDLYDLEIVEGVWFYTMKGLFDRYIDHYYKIKEHAKGAERAEAKLFLNNLYGKFASSTNSSYKIPYLGEDGIIHYRTIFANDKKPGYIPIGAAITSYARNETIRKAQMNYYGDDKPGFKYADTDSLHCDMPVDQLRGIPVHDSKLCHWKVEGEWDSAVFVRQKTYMEHARESAEDPYKWKITCAGMPEVCKQKIIYRLEEAKCMSPEDFRPGLIVSGKLYPNHVPGGIILEPGYYRMLE